MPESILQDVGPIIDESLGLNGCGIGKRPHYRHRKTCQKLMKSAPPTFEAKVLIEKMYEKVLSNWNGKRHSSSSEQNWRFESFPDIAENNGDPEIKLERAIVRTQWTPNNWANQVPTSSGLLGQHADKHRNIDLIHRCEDGAYELIELKVESNTPLYAAMEILQNAVLYIFYRERKKKLEAEVAEPKPILEARVLHLRVLAPCRYYEGYKLAWLEANICKGLSAYLATKMPDLQIDFRFDAFPPWFTVDHCRAIASKDHDDSIRKAVDDRKPVYS